MHLVSWPLAMARVLLDPPSLEAGAETLRQEAISRGEVSSVSLPFAHGQVSSVQGKG